MGRVSLLLKTFLLLLLAIESCYSLYFHILETERKCFIEEIPEETMVQGSEFETTKWNHSILKLRAMAIILVSVFMWKSKILTIRSSCPNCTHQKRVHLDIQAGEHTTDYEKVATKDKLNELQLRIRQLLDQTEQIMKEQNYQRYREEKFRETSESTNKRVLWWALAQTIILCGIGLWQMRHLKGFFEAKKLV